MTPAPISDTSDNATCVTTSDLPRPSRAPPSLPRALSLRAGVKSTRVARHAGARPNNTPANNEAAAVNVSARRALSGFGRLCGGRSLVSGEEVTSQTRVVGRFCVNNSRVRCFQAVVGWLALSRAPLNFSAKGRRIWQRETRDRPRLVPRTASVAMQTIKEVFTVDRRNAYRRKF